MRAFFLSVFAVCLLTGCSSPEARIKERPDAYAALPKKFQDAAAHGEVQEGMTPDAVYIALGRPARVLHGSKKGVARETWVYTRLDSENVPAWRTLPGQTVDGKPIFYTDYDPISVTHERDIFRVDFENGKVVGWQQL